MESRVRVLSGAGAFTAPGTGTGGTHWVLFAPADVLREASQV